MVHSKIVNNPRPNIRSFSQAFSGCTNLTSIPLGLFASGTTTAYDEGELLERIRRKKILKERKLKMHRLNKKIRRKKILKKIQVWKK